MQTLTGSLSGIDAAVMQCVVFAIVLVCVHEVVNETSFPAMLSAAAVFRTYRPKDGCGLHDPKQQRHPGGALRLFWGWGRAASRRSHLNDVFGGEGGMNSLPASGACDSTLKGEQVCLAKATY